jgi:hypothetical protein
VLLAELEIWHSRPIAPTRRVALGRSTLPTDPPPGFGGLLLGGIVAAHVGISNRLLPELGRLITDLEASRRIPQPRLRHRLQVDHIGLARSRHRLVGRGDASTSRSTTRARRRRRSSGPCTRPVSST